ncbi:hypothetical protein ACFU6K_07065 [Kitasatospora sp. NPDC057512]|uniref:hypothetical protein n=1 Tax=Kitasatospora sp. NPDC057512 TaxID=3346154 RepID=UPI00369E1E0C
MDTPVSEPGLRAFMGILPPTPHIRVAEFTRGRPELDTGRLEDMETIYARVTGQRPSIALDHPRPDAAADEEYGEGVLNGIWCGRAQPFPTPEDALAVLHGYCRALIPHGALHLDTDRPRWERGDTAEELLGLLAATGFHPKRVECEPARVRVLAIRKWRCCADGPRPLYDTHAV